MKALEKNNTWKLVTLSLGKKTCWVKVGLYSKIED